MGRWLELGLLALEKPGSEPVPGRLVLARDKVPLPGALGLAALFLLTLEPELAERWFEPMEPGAQLWVPPSRQREQGALVWEPERARPGLVLVAGGRAGGLLMW